MVESYEIKDEFWCFGPFRLNYSRKILLEGDRRVRLGSRAIDILFTLVEASGRIIPKEELISRAWPDTFVDDSNLRVHMSALRKVLGHGREEGRYIKNIPGRGYCFVAEVERSALSPEKDRESDWVFSELPTHSGRIVGRRDEVRKLVELVPRRRLVTIVGAGGVGKTTLSLAVAEQLLDDYADGVRFVDLGSLKDPALVTSSVASAVGVAVLSKDPLSDVLGFLKTKNMLFILDNCEHVIDAAARLAEAMHANLPRVHILATSREPLRIEDEWVWRLAGLGAPKLDEEPAASLAMAFPAVELFVERAMANHDGFRVTEQDARVVCEICRRLDGIPLAIELAAAWVDVYSLSEISAHLDDRFSLLTRGRRTAVARHRTLQATLEWSHALLSATEQSILRRVSVFRSAFTLDDAIACCTDDERDPALVSETIADLASKSMLIVDISGESTFFRLPESARAYARQELSRANEVALICQRHATLILQLVVAASNDIGAMSGKGWHAAHGRLIDDIRAALDWAFLSDGSRSTGIDLTIAAVPLWSQLSMVGECLARVSAARSCLIAEMPQDKYRRMRLYAVGWQTLYDSGADDWRKALGLAEELNNVDYQLRAIWALWADSVNKGHCVPALDLARKFSDLTGASAERSDSLIGDRITGVSQFLLGDFAGALSNFERMLGRYSVQARRAHIVRFQYDQRMAARNTLARLQWLQGFPDKAMREVESNIADSIEADHILSLGNALLHAACPVALMTGDLAAAERFTAMLRTYTATNSWAVWCACADCFEGQILVGRGDIKKGVQILRRGIEALQRIGFMQHNTQFLAQLAQALAEGGARAEALSTVEEGLSQCERTGERWCIAELHRVKGEILAKQELEADNEFHLALGIAREQGALSWELRAATSLARRFREKRLIDEAIKVLAPVHARFAEGFKTKDLTLAASVLEELETLR